MYWNDEYWQRVDEIHEKEILDKYSEPSTRIDWDDIKKGNTIQIYIPIGGGHPAVILWGEVVEFEGNTFWVSPDEEKSYINYHVGRSFGIEKYHCIKPTEDKSDIIQEDRYKVEMSKNSKGQARVYKIGISCKYNILGEER
jgi:hypothetical protein